MNRYVEITEDLAGTAWDYVVRHKNDLAIWVPVALVVIFLLSLIVWSIRDSMPHIVYQPTQACDLLTPSEAQDLLGDKIVNVEKNKPVISGNTATSNCGYADQNPDETSKIVAAVAIRSGINDKGVQQNKSEFTQASAGQNIEAVKGVGDKAFFNSQLGQLNVLSGNRWIILSYGVGASPAYNTIDKALELAHKVL